MCGGYPRPPRLRSQCHQEVWQYVPGSHGVLELILSLVWRNGEECQGWSRLWRYILVVPKPNFRVVCWPERAKLPELQTTSPEFPVTPTSPTYGQWQTLAVRWLGRAFNTRIPPKIGVRVRRYVPKNVREDITYRRLGSLSLAIAHVRRHGVNATRDRSIRRKSRLSHKSCNKSS